MDIRYRAATSLESVLAPMNAQLIRDEGHRNSMTIRRKRRPLIPGVN